MSDFTDKLLKLLALTAGGIGAAGLGVALASDQLGLGLLMFIIFIVGGIFIPNAAEIAASVFAIETFLFWVLAGTQSTMTKGDSFWAFLFFIFAVVILVFRRKIKLNS